MCALMSSPRSLRSGSVWCVILFRKDVQAENARLPLGLLCWSSVVSEMASSVSVSVWVVFQEFAAKTGLRSYRFSDDGGQQITDIRYRVPGDNTVNKANCMPIISTPYL